MTLFQTLFQQLAAFLAMRSQPSSCCRSAKTTDAFSAVIAIIIIIIAAPAYSLAQTVNLAFDDANEQVNAIAEDNIYVYIGGNFTIAAGQPRRGIARFVKTTGVLDMSWNPSVLPPHAGIDAMTVTHDAVYVGGTFSVTIGQKTWNGIIKLSTSTAEIDTTWNPSYPPHTVVSALANAHNSIYVALNHTVHKLSATTGEQDPLWKPYVPTFIRSMVVSGNSLYIAGLGNGGVKKVSLTTGTADPFWFFHSLDWIHTLAVSNSHVFIGGISGYTGWGGRGILERLSSLTGSRDNTWKARTSTYLHAIAVAGDDMYVGGIVTTIDGQIKSQGLVKISSLTGDIDNNWNAYPLPHNLAPDWYHLPNIRCLLASGSSLYVGGQFTSIAGKPRKNFAVIDINAYNSPVITSFTPTSGSTATVVTITGINFTGATAVSFGGVPATTFTVVSPTQITAVVGAGASGNVTVVTPNGTATAPGFVYITPPPPPTPAPVITSFTPTSGSTATVVTITGMNFTGATAVSFGGVPAATFTVVSPTQITAVVGAGTSGNISVVTPGGTATAGGFIHLPPPTIVCSPLSSTAATVTITGNNFTGTTSVSFGGIPASAFTVVSPTTITATIAFGSTDGSIHVTTPNGSASCTGFIYQPLKPIISSFSPAFANTGTVDIFGDNFRAISSVRFGGVSAASFVVLSHRHIRATLGSGASGAVEVVNPDGTARFEGFVFSNIPPIPNIGGFSPACGTTGTVVTITGSGFAAAKSVRFGNSPASFLIDSDTQIRATVQSGATGAVTVTSLSGTHSLPGFTYIADLPTITSFTPTNVGTGGTVTIIGTNFIASCGITTQRVTFGGTPAASFITISPTEIQAVVGSGASGTVQIERSDNAVARRTGFLFAAPVITGFSPSNGTTGTTVVITGTNFSTVTGASAVRVNNVNVASYVVNSDTQITAILASNHGLSGSVVVTNPNGSGSRNTFTFVPPPIVDSFFDSFGTTGATITINGRNFTGAYIVKFGAMLGSIISVTPTRIVATVGTGATGALSVTTPGGVGSRNTFRFAAAPITPPTIVNVVPNPVSQQDSILTITGASLGSATAVLLNSLPLTFVSISATQVRVRIPVGAASGTLTVYTHGGTATVPVTVMPLPTITGFTPTSGGSMTLVTITGTGFLGTSGAASVRFGSANAASYTVVSDNTITAAVAGGATGTIRVITPGGTVFSSSSFTFIPPTPPPTITSFTPDIGVSGTTITIRGTNFTGATSVSIGGMPAASFTVVSPTEITATVGAGASGNIIVSTPSGTASSAALGYTYTFLTSPIPVITSFAPAAGIVGSSVTIMGQNLTGTTKVTIGGVVASFTVISATEITATVPSGATTGRIHVFKEAASPIQFAVSATDYTVIPTLFLNANTANDEQPTTANEDLKTFATEEFTAYPSRVTDCLTLMYNTQSSGRIRFSIVNALGNVVWTFEQEGTGTVLHEVDMSRFAPGMYIVELRSNNRRSIRKVVRY